MKISSERHIDPRVQRTRETIRSVFQDMICKMPANKITITELTERAKIHRKTFYRHYTSIEALYEDILSEISNEYFAETDKLPLPLSFKDMNRIFFTYFSKQPRYVERLLCEPSYMFFCNKLVATSYRHSQERYDPFSKLSRETQNIICTFLTTTSLEIYRQWVADHKKMPLEDLIVLAGRLIDDGASGIYQGKNGADI